ncbi:MAG: hypothetical protein PHQ36_14230 [Anaerolineales bacterium]|nr:hypothetical protein [Anaerolineales bacterium]
MKKYGVLLSITALIFAALACQTLTGSGATEAPENNYGAEQPLPPDAVPTAVPDGGGNTPAGSEFPIPDGAFNVMNIGGALNFQVKMSLNDAISFYADAFAKSGYVERQILTVTSDTTFSMVFDGHQSGKAIVIQGVDLGDGSVNVNIRLEDI